MKPRVPFHVSPIFDKKMKEIQAKLKADGKDRSLRDLTEDLVNLKVFKEIENNIHDIKMDIKIRFDKRRIS